MEYNIIEDMKRTRANITLYELSKLKHEQKIMMKELHAVPVAPLPAAVLSQASHNMGRPPTNAISKIDPNDIALIGGISRSHTPPILLTYEIFNKNVHNCLIDSGASSNILPKSICAKLNVQPQKSTVCIVQLDRSQVEVIGELYQVTIRLSSNPKVCQVIDILVTDIPKFYGIIANSIIGNYSVDSFLNNFNAHASPYLEHSILSQVENFSRTDNSKCINFLDKPVHKPLFCKLFFYGSKSNGAGAGCILISPEGDKIMITCRLEFDCTSNTTEYEALVQGLYKVISLYIKYLQVLEILRL